MVPLSHSSMTTGKTIVLTLWTFVSKVMSLFFNVLSRFVITFLPRRKFFNVMGAVSFHSDSGVQENKVCYCFHCFPIYLPYTYRCIFISRLANTLQEAQILCRERMNSSELLISETNNFLE